MNAVVIIPTYNEKGNIELLIEVLETEIFPLIKNYNMSILIADDNSPDGTAEIVKEYMKKYKNIQLSEGRKAGLGSAYVRGMNHAIENMNADVVFEMDSDFFHDPKKLPAFLDEIDKGNDFVIGTRYSMGGSIPKDWGIHRKIMSVYGNLFIRILFGRSWIHDWTGGYRAIKKEVFLKEREKLKAFTGYTFQVGFLWNAVKDGYKIAEVPFQAKDRTRGKSKIPGIETIIRTLTYVIKVRIVEILTGSFGKFLVVGGTGFILQAVILTILVEVFGISPALASLTGSVVAIFSNYNLNNLWTFKKERAHGALQYFWKMAKFYATSAAGVIFIQTGIVYLGDVLIGRKYYFIYFVIGTGFLMIYNFTMYRFVIWRKKPHE